MIRASWLVASMVFIFSASIVNAAAPLAHGVQPSSKIDFKSSVIKSGLTKVAPGLAKAQGSIAAFVQFTGTPAVNASDAAMASGKAAAKKAAKSARVATDATAASVVKELKGKDAKTHELYRTTDAASGVAVVSDAAGLRALAVRKDVLSISQIVPKRIVNSNAVVLTNVVNTWESLGLLGQNVTIGVIDTGIDYTHANFGGPGTSAAYKAIDPTVVNASYFPTAKVVGGTDFVGNAYNADDPAHNVPIPDPNPIDCEGHGSHVSGTAAGFGEKADGSTFTGDYTTLTPALLAGMKIGPGTAPKALLYALKVFGCTGSTNVVGAALDWSLDPNGDGDFSDHLDVLNLSLGSDYAAPDDPENLITENVIAHGVLPVFAAGNGGDLYDIGNGAASALSVAASNDSRELDDAVEVTAPASVAGLKPGQYSVAFDYDGLDLTKPVVKMTDPTNLDGCKPFNAADAAIANGNFIWLQWDDNDTTRRCGSAGRSANAVTAGAAGAIFSSTLVHFAAGITGSAVIPVFQFNGPSTTAVTPALNAGTLVVRMNGDLRASLDTFDPSITDQVADFTSRSTRTPGVKPDVDAPGVTIVSTLSGSGNGRVSESGTSMATPHTAGIAALVVGEHPLWTPGQVKAAIMDTANHDVFAGPNQTGPIEGPNRVGSGRIDGLAATTNKVLAYDREAPGIVSVSFGVIEVAAAPVTIDRHIQLVNTGATAATYNVAYDGIDNMPGATYTLDKSSVTIAAGGTAEVKVTLTINPTALRKKADATTEVDQDGVARQFVADASGRVLFTATAGATVNLRVPVYAAPKPTAAITVPASLTIPGNHTAFLPTGGRGLNQGTGSQRYLSLMSALELGATSPRLPDCSASQTSNCAVNQTERGGDLRYVGAASTVPAMGTNIDPNNAFIGFGIATWDNWANIGSNTIPFVDIDVNGDHTPDFEAFVTKLAATDVLVVELADLSTGDIVDAELANNLDGSVDANVFDSNVIVLPVWLPALGIDPTAKSHRITYQVGTAGFYHAANDSVIDASPVISYNPLKPGLWASGNGAALIYVASAPSGLNIHKNTGEYKKDKSKGLLVLNFHNATGHRAAVVTIK